MMHILNYLNLVPWFQCGSFTRNRTKDEGTSLLLLPPIKNKTGTKTDILKIAIVFIVN